MNTSDLSRRDFLRLVRTILLWTCALLGMGGLVRFLDTRTQPDPETDFDAGSADGFADGSRTVLTQVPAMLIKDAQGFHAVSLVCTHLGCTVETRPEGFACPCHGSRFDPQGRVTRGPATQPLIVLRTEITADGRLHIHTN
jgi:cytochrome b6-f complex iron-sulfur subunit